MALIVACTSWEDVAKALRTPLCIAHMACTRCEPHGGTQDLRIPGASEGQPIFQYSSRENATHVIAVSRVWAEQWGGPGADPSRSAGLMA